MLVTYYTLLVVAGFISAADKCQTPTGQNGDCKPINQCPSLHAIFSAPSVSTKKANFLRSHYCGLSGNTPKVCCVTATANTSLSSVSLDHTSCGYTIESKIFGGEKAELDEFPWMALLQYEESNGFKHFACDGFLISKRYVLTAAHCIKASLTNVRLGEYDTATSIDCIRTSLGEDCADPLIDVPIEEKIIHEGYDFNELINKYNDIGLLRLTKEVTLSDYINPICLPVSTEELTKSYIGEKLFVAGWGLTENGRRSNIKLKVKVPVKNSSDCENKFRSIHVSLALSTGQLCAGGEKGKDSCKYDSGGPLMTVRKDKNKDNQWYAAGMVSFGPRPCAVEDVPAVYTKISKYVSWINSKLKA